MTLVMLTGKGQIPLERPDRTLSETGSYRPGSPTKSGRVALVEFGLNADR